ncbi:Transcription factor SPT20 [Chamberlinius hualienensis]
MELDWERAEYIVESTRQRPKKIKNTHIISPTPSKWKSIHQKLQELYVEECHREPKHNRLLNASHLLDKLVAREKISCLVVNLYAGNEGYSVMLKGRNGADTETVRLPYEESELLQYIDNEELPPVLVDILECSQINIFYSGCVVAEVRDYRRSTSPSIYEVHHVLLRPSMQTLICDVNSITNDGNKWSYEDKMTLESNLLLATQEPLCLEPSVSVTLVANYMQHSRQKFNVAPIKNMAKRYSQTAINRKWKFEQHSAPPNLKLYDFLLKHRDKQRSPLVNLRMNKNTNETWKPNDVVLETPSLIEVEKFAKPRPAPEILVENVLDFVEKYTLESKQSNGKGYYCQLSIYMRSLDDRYIGHLYTDRDYLEGIMKGATCRFELGSKLDVDRYLHQFIEIFIQESRKTVKISHEVKGQGTSTTSVPVGQSVVFPLLNSGAMQSLETSVQQQNISQPSDAEMIAVNVVSPTVNTVMNLVGKRSNNSTPLASRSLLSSSSPGTSLVTSNFPFSNLVVNKTSIPTLKTLSNLTDSSGSSVAVNSPPLNRRSQQSETVSSINAIGLSTGIVNVGEQPISKVTNVGVASGIAVPLSKAVLSPSQSSIITPQTRAVVGSIPNVMGDTTSLPGTQTMPITVTNDGSSTLMVTSGMPNLSSVITAPTGVVSIPVAISGGLGTTNVSARFIAPAIGIQTHRPNAVGLLQVSGSQLINTGTVPWVGGTGTSSPQAATNTTPPHSGTTPPPNVANVGTTLMTVPSNFNQSQLHVVHQATAAVLGNTSASANKMKRKRTNVTSPK